MNLKDRILNWKLKRAKKKAIKLKIQSGLKHIVIVDDKGKFYVINRKYVREASKNGKIKGITWQYFLNRAVFVTQ